MNLRKYKHGFCAALLVLTLSSAGCMMTPGHYEVVNSIHDPVNFSGVTLEPDTHVYLFARQPGSTTWNYVGMAKSSSVPTPHLGVDWYVWQTDRVIPLGSWAIGGWFSVTEVRAIQSGGSDLLTFDAGFLDYLAEYDDLGDLWNERGHGTTALVFAQN